jgi:N-methylhydantoinase B
MSITLKRVSGSTTTTEANDYEAALYTPSGEIASVGRGVTGHVVPAAAACKHVVTRYSDKNIHEGDVFLLNDPYVAAFHQSDIYFISPIHFEEQLVGWAANFTHIIDIGAIDPGGFSPSSREVYQEGLRIPSVKIVSKGELNADLFELITNNSREPGLAALDMRAQLAANNIAKDRVIDLIKRYGYHLYKDSLDQMIRNSEIMIRGRLKELPDGEWTSRIYEDLVGGISKVELRMVKRGDNLLFDFEGTSPQAPVGMNCTIHGTRGMVFAAIAHLIGYDIPWNEGLLRPAKVVAPRDSLVNCSPPAPVSMATVGIGSIAIHAATVTISKMIRSSPRYAVDSSAVWGGFNQAVRIAGKTSTGQSFVSADTDHLASGTGALNGKDGIDTGGVIMILKASIPNIEYYELHYPLMYLFRRQLCDSAGAGKFRGGSGGEAAKVLLGDPSNSARLVLSSLGINAAESLGIFGGYPGCTGDSIIIRGSNALDIYNSGVIPESLHDVKGKFEYPSPQSAHGFSYGDLFYRRWAGGGGYGDPLDRDPHLVEKDVIENVVSRKAASSLYGVMIATSGVLDEAATSKVRREIINQRMSQRKEAGQFAKVSNQNGIEVSEGVIAVSVSGKDVLACKRCAAIISESNRDWRRSALVRDEPLPSVNPLITNAKDLFARSFDCPSCGAILSCEVYNERDMILYDEPKIIASEVSANAKS